MLWGLVLSGRMRAWDDRVFERFHTGRWPSCLRLYIIYGNDRAHTCLREDGLDEAGGATGEGGGVKEVARVVEVAGLAGGGGRGVED